MRAIHTIHITYLHHELDQLDRCLLGEELLACTLSSPLNFGQPPRKCCDRASSAVDRVLSLISLSQRRRCGLQVEHQLLLRLHVCRLPFEPSLLVRRLFCGQPCFLCLRDQAVGSFKLCSLLLFHNAILFSEFSCFLVQCSLYFIGFDDSLFYSFLDFFFFLSELLLLLLFKLNSLFL